MPGMLGPTGRSSVKDGVDGSPPLSFDKDGLELAFKYFCSTTLTMRLAGIAQVFVMLKCILFKIFKIAKPEPKVEQRD